MDPLTHATLGIAVALAASPRGASLPSIALAGFAAGTLPDTDIFLHSNTDPLFSIEYHRHFTHSVLFSPIIALIGSALAWLTLRCCWKPSPYHPMIFPAWLAALSHLFCDLWTSYGTRIAWPFNNDRYALDWISVIDPLFTLPVLALTLVALVKARPRPAQFALIYAATYLALCFVQHERATLALQSWLKTSGPGSADRLIVHPSFGNILVWRALFEKDRVAHNVAIRCGLGTPNILQGQSTPVFNHPDQAITELKIDPASPQARDIRRFFHFSHNWVAPLPNDPQSLGDLRYSALPDSLTPLWGIQILPPHTTPPIKWREFDQIENRSWNHFLSLIKGDPFPPNNTP
jgi:inner membrane protein